MQLGVFDADENALLRRYGIPQQWPAEVLRQVEFLGAGSICSAVNDPGREVLTQLYVCGALRGRGMASRVVCRSALYNNSLSGIIPIALVISPH